MPWAQHAEAFQERLETGNSLISGLPDPLTAALVLPIGANLSGSKSPESVPLPTLLNFKEQSTESIKLFGVLRQTPSEDLIQNVSCQFAK